MRSSPAFEWVCDQVEERTPLDRLEARGTVRLTLRDAGLEARSVTGKELEIVVDRLLSPELAARGVHDPDAICAAMAQLLASLDLGAGDMNTPDALFDRLEAS